jgi:hypothetical protein
MNSEERRMIADLFERMRNYGPVDKEDEADRMIREEVRRVPDAPYMLVQSVLVQEMALRRADERIRELEERVGELEAGRGRAEQSGGSFLGGLFGGGSRSPDSDRREGAGARASSVPSVGRGPLAASERDRGGWRPGAAPPMGRGGGGGFLQSAMATAAGVAGGVLLADSIRGLMGGGQAGTAAAGEAAGKEASSQETSQPQADQQQEAQHQDPADNDPGTEDAGYDGGDWGGDGGSFDV